MTIPQIRWLTLLALLFACAGLCAALLLDDALTPGSALHSRAALATLAAASALGLWPLYAMPLAVRDRPQRLGSLLEALVVAVAVALVVCGLAGAQAAMRLLPVLLLLLVVVNLLLGLRIHRITLTAFVVLAMLSPAWLAPAAAAPRTLDMAATLAVKANPLSALATACQCDYLRSLWFYQHSNIGASNFEYPALGSILLSCAALTLGLALLSMSTTSEKSP